VADPTTSTTPFALTKDPLIDAMTFGFVWTLGADRTIDWSISDGYFAEHWKDSLQIKDHVESILNSIASFANIKFNYVGSFRNPTLASHGGSELNVSLSWTLFTSNNIWAVGFPPWSGYTSYYTGGPGDVVINANSDAYTLPSFDPGSTGYLLLLHEIGHALGLKHPHDSGGTGRPTFTQAGFPELDSDLSSVMSYDDSYVFNDVSWDPATPMIMDVLALQYLYGKNTATNAGDTTHTLKQSEFYSTIWDASGNDAVTAADSKVGWYIYLPDDKLSKLADNNVGYATPLAEQDLEAPHTFYWLTGDIENAVGSPFDDEIYGTVGNNVLTGGAGADFLLGWTGDDTLNGGAGDDDLDGGDGVDKAVFAGASKDYSWWSDKDGDWWVNDVRATPTDGLDLLIDMEALQFSDRTIKLTGLTNAEFLANAFENILFSAPTSSADTAFLNGLSSQVDGGSLTRAAALDRIVQMADATTGVATVAYEFFLGFIPSKGGYNFLVSPTGPNANNINGAYYQSFTAENRYINFAVNLGKQGEGKAGFESAYGALTLAEATRKAYTTIFGAAPTDAKVAALLEPSFSVGGQTMTRAEYFAYYGQDGANGLGTKAAMVGWLLAEAQKADIGTYARSNNAFLADLADGAEMKIDLVGVYGKAEYVYIG
jgi:serralysin